MPHVALWEPEIPPNTGNVMRLCAATGAALHLIGRLGFRTDDRSLRRAGVDCRDRVVLHRHATLADFESAVAPARVLCFSAHARRPYTAVAYQEGDHLLFGGESAGLPPGVVERYGDNALCIPMPGAVEAGIRSLNLANAVAIVLYEALRQVRGW
jgi:tRNA (cytidine/uridine-2'-O-)-methyltransferase